MASSISTSASCSLETRLVRNRGQNYRFLNQQGWRYFRIISSVVFERIGGMKIDFVTYVSTQVDQQLVVFSPLLRYLAFDEFGFGSLFFRIEAKNIGK